jgi:plastocyanin
MQQFHFMSDISISALHRHLSWHRVLVVALLLAMMALAACGGGGGETPGEAVPSAVGEVKEAVPSAVGEVKEAVPSAVGEVKEEAKEAVGAGGETTVNMTDSLQFEPADLTIKKGGTITWKNTGTVPHTATDDPSKATDKSHAVLPSGAQPWDSGTIAGGGSWSHTFDVAGDYTYFCVPHEAAGMIGHIKVTE